MSKSKKAEKKKFVMGHCETHAPRYVVTCGGLDFPSWHMSKREALRKISELREKWSGTGVFPTITLMKTEIHFQKEVDMEF